MQPDGQSELYNLSTDGQELSNLAGSLEHRSRLLTLRKNLENAMREVNDTQAGLPSTQRLVCLNSTLTD